MTDKKKIEQIRSYSGIGIIDDDLLTAETLRASMEEISSCLEKFFSYDFGDLSPDLTAINNKSILTGQKDFFGSYELPKGRLSISLYDGKYRFVFERRD